MDVLMLMAGVTLASVTCVAGIGRGSTLGASMLLPQVMGCAWGDGRSSGVCSMISTELQLGKDTLTMHDLVDGLAVGWGGVILTVGASVA